MTALLALSDQMPAIAWAALAVFLRVGAAMAILPGLGERVIPARVRLLAAVALTAIVAPSVWETTAMPAPSLGGFARLLATETLSGLTIGLSLRLFILALQTAGSIAAQSTSLSQLLGAAAMDPLPAIGHLLTVAALALMMITGMHVKIAALLMLSYELFPMGQFPDAGLVGDWARGHVTQAFALAFTLAAPFVILSMLYNLTLGVINRAMPQLMVAFVGAPVITLGAIALLFITAPVMLSVWLNAVDSFLSNPFRAL